LHNNREIYLKIFFLILVTMAMASAYASLPSLKVIPRIVGGIEVDSTITDTSFVVSIGGGCAGTIIDAKWILTAAHCEPLFQNPVTAGSINLVGSDRIVLKITKTYVHPKFHDRSYDFALLELASPIDFAANQRLSKIDIADANLESSGGLEPDTIATVYGWGTMSENGSQQPSIIREVDVPLVSRSIANSKKGYNGEINETMIVAGYLKGGKDSCQGDSGGPLINKETRTLIGVVSFGFGCARAHKYGIYSNVSNGNEWITSVMKK
jgi:trypsin